MLIIKLIVTLNKILFSCYHNKVDLTKSTAVGITNNGVFVLCSPFYDCNGIVN